jgi:hypothetical protein
MTTLGEFDFIVISLPLKSIIHIEAKAGYHKSSRRSASEQLESGLTFFKEKLPLPATENWKYIKMMCFGEFLDNEVCVQCRPFILGTNFIIENTLQSISREIAHQLHPLLSCTVSVDDSKGNTMFQKYGEDIFACKGIIISICCRNLHNLGRFATSIILTYFRKPGPNIILHPKDSVSLDVHVST